MKWLNREIHLLYVSESRAVKTFSNLLCVNEEMYTDLITAQNHYWWWCFFVFEFFSILWPSWNTYTHFISNNRFNIHDLFLWDVYILDSIWRIYFHNLNQFEVTFSKKVSSSAIVHIVEIHILSTFERWWI